MDNYDHQVDVARHIFLEHDQQRLIRKYGLKADDNHLYLTYLNTPCRICRKTGALEEHLENTWRECRNFSTVMTVYDLLCHHKGDALPPPALQWCTVGSFVIAGVTETEKFTKKYAKRFEGRLDALKAACQKLGGTIQPRMAGADVTCLFPVTHFFSVLLQFWDGDDEFPPKLLLLWDRNADRYLHFETTFYLQGDLLERLKAVME